MRILAITDGSIAALEIIEPLNGIVPIDVHVLPHPIANEIKRAEVIVLAFDHFPTRSLEKLFDWLRDQGLRRAPVVLCLTAEEVARFSSAMRQISATIVSVPATSDTLLDAVEKSYRPFRGFRRQAGAGPACAVQSLASSYASVLSGKKPPAKGTVDQIAEAGADVSKMVRTHGLESWMAAVGLHHSYTARHCMSVAGFAADWAHKLKFSVDDQKLFTQAGLLHDIGKMNVPLAILDKPTQLTDEERAIINRHPEDGLEIVNQDLNVSPIVKDIIHSHHELLDGSGYPRGISGAEISDVVRCMTIIDIYSALIDTRAYKRAMSPDEAYQVLASMKGKIDEELLRSFRAVVEAHKATSIQSSVAA
jgi:putative nucleotidyltransferase with HDIG domain